MTKQINTEEDTAKGMTGVFGGTNAPEPESDLTSPTPPTSGSATIGSSVPQTSAPVKAMPKQQKAGTGTFANLKAYLQAAQGGGQQKVAQAATGQVQRLGAGAQKATQQAQKTFGAQLGAGSGAIFQGDQSGQYLSQADASARAQAQSKEAIEAARAATYQAPTQQEAPAEDSPVNVTPQQYTTPTQQQQFANIINAQYQGPESLQKAGLYEPAASKARKAQQAGQLTESAQGREQLLRDIFGRTRDYSRGASKLDTILLNTSEQGVKQLQQQAQPAAKAQQELQAAQNLSANEAAQREAAIEQIRSGARKQLTGARTEEETKTNEYIENIRNNWDKLPDYFRDLLIQNSSKTANRIGDTARQLNAKSSDNSYYDRYITLPSKGTTYNLSSEEAKILGLTPGQGLFGVTPADIQATEKASGAELITKDQLSRQLALAQLANLDTIGGLKKDLQYTDLEKAGTKNILSSLDTERLQGIQKENREKMEKSLSTKKTRNLSSAATLGGYNQVNIPFLDLLKQGGYTPLGMEGLSAESRSEDLLRSIAEGQEYTPQQNEIVKNYIQKIYENPEVPYRNQKIFERGLVPLQNEISKYGAFDTVQLAENEQTAERAQALRDLLSGIYKK